MNTYQQAVIASRIAHKRMAHITMCETLAVDALRAGTNNEHVAKMLNERLDRYAAEYDDALAAATAADRFLRPHRLAQVPAHTLTSPV